ncbi:MAG: matrixin family metalloprotease [Roseovarius sp.]
MLNDDVRALVGDDPHPRWNIAGPLGTAAVVTYSFPTEPAPYDTGQTSPTFAGFSAAHQVHIRTALNTWSASSGLIFVEVPAGQGDIRFSMFDMSGLINSDGNQLSGFGYYPGYGWTSSGGQRDYYQSRDNLGGDIFLNSNYYEASSGSIAPGQRGYSILLHEIGHAIGFEHPFEGEHTIDPSRDNGIYTVMSYDRSRSTTDLGSVDRQALEYLYGATDGGVQASYDAARGAVEITGPNAATWLLAGWSGPNDITGGAGDDTLEGERGDDTLEGGAGNDTVDAAEGDDVIVDGAGNDSYDGGIGTDTLIVQADRSGIVVEHRWLGGSVARPGGDTDMFERIEIVRVEGAFGVEMTASSNDLEMFGGSGDDTLTNRYDRVLLDGGAGDDLLMTQPFGQVSMQGGAGEDTLEGNTEADHLDGGTGDDMMNGGGGNDTLVGNAGADAMDGGAGIDLADYGGWAGRVLVDLASDVSGAGFARFFDEGAGAGDTFALIENVTGGEGADNLRGDSGDNALTGGGVSDRLYGRAGNDTLDGGTGADAIYGNTGADVMTGGPDAGRTDRFIYFNAVETGVGAGNRDIITDFVSGEARQLRRIDATSPRASSSSSISSGCGVSGSGELRSTRRGASPLCRRIARPGGHGDRADRDDRPGRGRLFHLRIGAGLPPCAALIGKV